MATSAAELIRLMGLEPHPEGGYFKECYRCQEGIEVAALPERYTASRSMSTSIYFLLQADDISALHRLNSDEIWHYHLGDPLDVSIIHPDGQLEQRGLGPDWAGGDRFQIILPQNTWFGARLRPGGSFTLMGCTVAPGFDFSDFQLGTRRDLLAQYPQHRKIIEPLTPRE